MKRTTIFLPESLERQLQQFARRQEKPVAAVVREAVTKHLESHREPFQMPRTFDSGRSDVATRFEELVFQDFDIHGGTQPRTTKRKKR
ncbi:MAG: CopG family transcriptional regulator [Acidobacteriota bacterium]|nr:CopG family transcriptional regulator [Acidobacteriota bacterium]